MYYCHTFDCHENNAPCPEELASFAEEASFASAASSRDVGESSCRLDSFAMLHHLDFGGRDVESPVDGSIPLALRLGCCCCFLDKACQHDRVRYISSETCPEIRWPSIM